MNPTYTAILAGIIRQIVIGISGALVAHGIKVDDSNIEWMSGVGLALATMAYSAAKKWWLQGEVADLKEQLKLTPKE